MDGIGDPALCRGSGRQKTHQLQRKSLEEPVRPDITTATSWRRTASSWLAKPKGRWRSAASPAKELEIEIEGSCVQAATGQKRIVVPWSEAVRYGSKKNGYHGGVSLQEAVVPVGVFVGPGEELHGWNPVAMVYPSWWCADSPGLVQTELPAPAESSVP